MISTGHHVSIDGEITPEELIELSATLDLKNGWLNRFLFFHSALWDVLPFGGSIDRVGLAGIAEEIKEAFAWLGEPVKLNGVSRTYHVWSEKDAKTAKGKALARFYDPWYRSVRTGTGLGADLTCRQHVHVPRLMLILAVLDRAERLTVEHFEAAKAWNDYSVATIERLFDCAGVFGKTKQLLNAVRETGEAGLDGTKQVLMFKNSLDTAGVARLRPSSRGAS